MEIPFEIDKVYWLPKLSSSQQMVPCNVCYGNKVITVILGNGEEVEIPCEGCSVGADPAHGYHMEYVYTPSVNKFKLVEIQSYTKYQGKDEWTVKSETGEITKWEQLEDTKEKALEVSEATMKKLQEDNFNSCGTRRNYSIQKASWHIHYHRTQVKEHERKLEYHRGKVKTLAVKRSRKNVQSTEKDV